VKLERLTNLLPSWKNAVLAGLAAVLLILAFPDFDLWFLAWFALVPLLFAIERETERGHSCPHERGSVRNDSPATESVRPSGSWGQECPRSFILGWIFGVVFFSGTCWWLTYAPITYAGFPPLLAYFLLLCVTSVAAIFPGMFAAITSIFRRRFGTWAFLLAPIVWVFTEFLRYWLTGNNWNALGYSQAFNGRTISLAAYGGVLLMSFALVVPGAALLAIRDKWKLLRNNPELVNTMDAMVWKEYGRVREKQKLSESFFDYLPHIILVFLFIALPIVLLVNYLLGVVPRNGRAEHHESVSNVVAVQPNVPAVMTPAKWDEYRRNHIRLAESALATLSTEDRLPTTVIFPESPMNFAYEVDDETRAYINAFAIKNNVSVLFNSAEPDVKTGKYYNSAVMVGPDGKEVAQYDKIYLLPFGEAVPFPFDGLLPGFVGNFSYGGEYDLFPLGDAKAGVMICFESHFGQLSREYVRNGADVIIEMTNDGYLGPTPVLRQHLANAVFRAVEMNRPVLRVTNVGITAYVTPSGQVLDAADTYTEATRVWSVAKSDGSQTFYVRYGDWFAWLCTIVTVVLLIFGIVRHKGPQAPAK